jgi:hypothetical protein
MRKEVDQNECSGPVINSLARPSVLGSKIRTGVSSGGSRSMGRPKVIITDEERAEIWAYVQAAPINMTVRDMICRIGRDESPTAFPACLQRAD